MGSLHIVPTKRYEHNIGSLHIVPTELKDPAKKLCEVFARVSVKTQYFLNYYIYLSIFPLQPNIFFAQNGRGGALADAYVKDFFLLAPLECRISTYLESSGR